VITTPTERDPYFPFMRRGFFLSPWLNVPCVLFFFPFEKRLMGFSLMLA
jgi:hypothetical protein